MRWRTSLLALAILLGSGRAFERRWISDDATISFRYAENLLAGRGLVFNAGEAVEGYTNFLWTLGTAGAMALGLDPAAFSIGLGIACFAATILLIGRAGGGPLPVAACALAGISLAADFATSGLETSLFTLLLTAAVLGAERAERSRQAMGLGLLCSLALLTRPEGALVAGIAVLALALGPAGGRAALAAAGPVALTGLAWGAWKLQFYGDLLPNTFHAKAGEGARWAQGITYLSQFFGSFWPVGLGLPALALWGARAGGREVRRSILLFGLLPALYLAHVARVGGDFMAGRFCLPLAPILLLSLERALQARLAPRWSTILRLLVIGVCALGLTPQELERARSGGLLVDGVIDERAFYAEQEPAILHQIAVLRPYLEGQDLRLAFFGAQARLVWALRVPYALEGEVGLTDAEIARLPSPPGSRIGHGPRLTLARAVERQIDLFIDRPGDAVIASLASPRAGPHAAARVDFGQGVTGWLVRERPELTATLEARGARILRREDDPSPAR